MGGDIVSKICHLSRSERFSTEKPFNYSAELAILPGIPPSNHEVSFEPVTVHDVREYESPKLETHGFTFSKSQTGLSSGDFDDEALVERVLYPELEDLLWKERPDLSGIAFLGHQVRRRSSKFPCEKGTLVSSAQPQTLAHSDLTLEGAQERLEPYFNENPELQGRPWEMLNFWRVLRGPSNDWPLALCDHRTVDVNSDTIANDIVVAHGTGSIESSLLQHSPKHEWYYRSDMDVDDVIIFRQVDSTGRLPRAWHASFENPKAEEGPVLLRESIEIRAVAFQ